RTRIFPVGEDDDLVLQSGDVAQPWTALVIGPEIFAIWVENHRAHRDLLAGTLGDKGRRLVELREEQLVEIGFAEARSGKDEAAARYQRFDREADQNLRIDHLHPFLRLE